LVPITTPFDVATGDVAPVSLRDNARQLLASGASGLVAAGSTGEAALLSDEESNHIIEWLRDVVDDEQWLIAGTGRESTRATVEACRAAAERGADAVLVRTPSYYAPNISDSALLDHFQAVADESPVPVLLYNMPKYTNLPIPDTLIASLVGHQNIWGAKDSSGDLKNFSAYRDAAPNWTMLMGSAALCYAALELGAAGTIAAVGCYAPAPVAAICERFFDGDRAGAGVNQEMVAPLHTDIVGKLGVAGVKSAMDAVGLIGGPMRAPLAALGDKAADGVRRLLKGAGLHAVDAA
jgi:4-hydroxy-2-oxoglutarate aldolase